LFAALGVISIASAEMIRPGPDGDQVWALDVKAPNGAHNLLMGSMHVPDRDLHQPDPRIL